MTRRQREQTKKCGG